jgi:hypothetical protein
MSRLTGPHALRGPIAVLVAGTLSMKLRVFVRLVYDRILFAYRR